MDMSAGHTAANEFQTHLALHPDKTTWLLFCYTSEEGFEESIDVKPGLVHLVALQTRAS